MVLGRFDNFPKNIHKVAVFNYQHQKTVQKTILQTVQRLNTETFAINDIMPFFGQDNKVTFELGIADGSDFIFLDKVQLKQTLKFIDEDELEVLDFFVVVRYHRISDKGKLVPLRFDYHVLRFAFHEKILELLLRHERGTQRIVTEDLVEFFIKKINLILKKRQMPPLTAD